MREQGSRAATGGLLSVVVATMLLASCGGSSESAVGRAPPVTPPPPTAPPTGNTVPGPRPVAEPQNFVAYESGQVRPLALSADGQRLYAVNTPDNKLEIFSIAGGLTSLASVPVGLEPIALAEDPEGRVWVVNHLSDSISVVEVNAVEPHVTQTLLVGDEPRDIVFAGTNRERAFITTAHRGQNSPYQDPGNPGELITPGIGRADVWVFDALRYIEYGRRLFEVRSVK